MKTVISMLLTGMLLTSQSALAQDSWWDRGKALLEGFSGDKPLTTTEIADGLREALRVGTGNVVNHLGRENGYYNDARAHIPLPDSLARARDTLAKIGMSNSLDELELRMNRAAEAAAPKARAMFIDAIRNLTLDDVRRIYNGPDDAATRYFQGQMSQPLTQEFTPIVNDSLSQVGAIKTYDNIKGRYEQIPFVPDIKADLSAHVVDHAITAIFDYLAIEEAAIRNNPAKRTTELLQKVFGS